MISFYKTRRTSLSTMMKLFIFGTLVALLGLILWSSILTIQYVNIREQYLKQEIKR